MVMLWLVDSLWLTIVTSYDVMTFAHDSYCELWVLGMWLIGVYNLIYEFWLVKGIVGSDPGESGDGFHPMSHYES